MDTRRRNTRSGHGPHHSAVERSFYRCYARASPKRMDHAAPMTATPEDLFAFLDDLGIEHSTMTHPPIFTVEEGRAWHDKIPGLHCKNLFLKDKKNKVWLAVMPGDKRADLNRLEKRLRAARL